MLYSNALWYGVKRRFGLPDAEATRYHFNHLFFPYSRERPDYRRLRLLTHYVRNRSQDQSLYLSFVNFSFWGDEGDVLGNLLAILFGLAGDGPAHRIMHALNAAGVDTPWPVRAVCTPIAERSGLWRTYMERHRQNLPWRYHNGGAWPFIGGFWVLALAGLGQASRARAALARLAEANRRDGWRFTEWFDGCTGAAHGMAGQSWNAAMFLLARYVWSNAPFLFFHAKTDLDADLPVSDTAVDQVATGLEDFKPVHIAQGLRGTCDGVVDRLVTACGRRTDQFHQLIDMVTHGVPPCHALVKCSVGAYPIGRERVVNIRGWTSSPPWIKYAPPTWDGVRPEALNAGRDRRRIT